MARGQPRGQIKQGWFLQNVPPTRMVITLINTLTHWNFFFTLFPFNNLPFPPPSPTRISIDHPWSKRILSETKHC